MDSMDGRRLTATGGTVAAFTDIFMYLGVFFLMFLVLKQLLDIAQKEIQKPKPAVKNDEFMKEFGYSYDFAFVFQVFSELDKDDITPFQQQFSMKACKDRFEAAGLQTSCFYSCQRDEIYIKVRAVPSRILSKADQIDYKFQLDPDKLKNKAQTGKAGVWKKIRIPDPYQISSYEPWEYIYGMYMNDPEVQSLYKQYEAQEGKKYPFREIDRMKLLVAIFEEKVQDGGCGLFLDDLLMKQACLAIMPIHNYDSLDALQRKWLNLVSYPWMQPLVGVKDYYGEKLGLYFAYLGFYCSALLPMSGVAFAMYLVLKLASHYGAVEHPVLPAFAVCMTIWSSVYVEFWKRYQSQLAMEWGMTGFETTELDRPQFEGLSIKSPVDGSQMTYFPDEEKKARLSTVQSIVSTSLVIVVAAVGGTFFLQWIMAQPQYVAMFTISLGAISFNFGSIITPLLNAVVIGVLNFSYMKIVYDLNDYENHRTATEYEDALVAKVFTFQLVNSFAALTYISFIKGWIGMTIIHCLGPRGNCTGDVATTLSTVFISREISTMISEIFVREMTQKAKEAVEFSGLEPGAKPSPLEEQYCKAPYDAMRNALVEYAGLVIQYGYMVLFVAAFPLSVTLACASIYIKIRIDGWKLCQMFRRPMPKSAEDIGMWQDMIEIISMLGVTYNFALIFFTGFYVSNYTWPIRWIFFIACEHIMFAIKYIIATVVDDVTEEVSIQLQRNEFLISKVLDNLEDVEDEEYGGDDNEPLNLIVETTDLAWEIPSSGDEYDPLFVPEDEKDDEVDKDEDVEEEESKEE